MATRKDVELRIGATTTGADEVRALAARIAELAKEGGDAAPEFERLAGELQKIGTQTEAVQQFDRLNTEIEKTKQSLTDTTTKVEAASNALRQQTDIVTEFKNQQSAAKVAVDQTGQQIRELEAQLRTLRATSDGAARQTDEYKKSVNDLRVQLADLKNKQVEQKAALDATNAATKDAGKALKAANTEYTKAAAEAQKFVNTLKSQTAELDKSRDNLSTLGIAASSVADAQTQVKDSFNETSRAAVQQAIAFQRAKAETEALERAQRLLSAELQLQEEIARDAIAAQEREAEAARRAAQIKAQAAAEAEAAARQATEAIRQQAQAAERALNEAFAVTGVRSAREIQREIAEITRALARLSNNAQVSGADFDRAFASGQRRIEALKAELAGVDAQTTLAGRATRFLQSQFAELAAAYGALELSQKFIDANVQLETLRRSLSLINGSTQVAAQQIDFLRATADRSGQSFGELSKSFVNFSASARTSGLSLELTNEVFAAISNAAGQLGLSTDKAGLQLQALAQIANKGKVSLEELQGQLGESLPGALNITARGLGITTAELVKLTEQGDLLAEDFFPAFARSLRETFGEGEKQITGFAATWNRLKNLITETATTFGDGGALEVLAISLRGLTALLAPLVIGFSVLFDGIVTGAKAAGIALGGLATGDFRGAMTAIGEEADKAVARQNKLIDAFGRVLSGSDAAAPAIRNAGTAVEEAGAKSEAAATQYASNATAQTQAASAATANAAAQSASGNASAQAGQQAASASSGWVQLQVAYKNTITSLEAATVVTTKLAEAKKLEGETTVALAELAGNETAAREISAQTAAAYAESLGNVAVARQAEASAVQAQIDALRAEGEATGGLSAAKQKQIADLEQLLERKQAEAARSTEAVAAARLEAAERQVVAQTYADNSARLDELKAAAEGAAGALDTLRVAESIGAATSEQVAAATIANAQAQALYRDALNDVAEAAERKIQAIRSDAEVTRAALNLDLQRARTAEVVAQAQGNETAAIAAKVAQKEIEVRITQANIAATEAEAAASIAAAEADRQALQASGELTPAKEAEIEARIRNAEAKRLEAQAGKEVVAQIEAEIEALRRRNQQSAPGGFGGSSSASSTSPTFSSPTGAGGTGGGGRTGSDGVNIESPTLLSIYNALRGYGLDDSTARRIAREFTDGNGNVPYFDNPGQRKYGEFGSTISDAIRRAAERELFSGGSSINSNVGGSNGTSGGVYRVDISLGGRTTSVETASDADARALTGVLTQLGDAASRSSLGGGG
jgi:tape measure domain-containing protein